MAKKKKEKYIVYSTNNSFEENEEFEDEETLQPSQQDLRVNIDRKQRKGKAVTLVTGFIGSEYDLKELGKEIKSKCGVGGSAKNSEIIIQGEVRDKVIELLLAKGYKVKKSGGN